MGPRQVEVNPLPKDLTNRYTSPNMLGDYRYASSFQTALRQSHEVPRGLLGKTLQTRWPRWLLVDRGVGHA